MSTERATREKNRTKRLSVDNNTRKRSRKQGGVLGAVLARGGRAGAALQCVGVKRITQEKKLERRGILIKRTKSDVRCWC